MPEKDQADVKKALKAKKQVSLDVSTIDPTNNSTVRPAVTARQVAPVSYAETPVTAPKPAAPQAAPIPEPVLYDRPAPTPVYKPTSQQENVNAASPYASASPAPQTQMRETPSVDEEQPAVVSTPPANMDDDRPAPQPFRRTATVSPSPTETMKQPQPTEQQAPVPRPVTAPVEEPANSFSSIPFDALNPGRSTQ